MGKRDYDKAQVHSGTPRGEGKDAEVGWGLHSYNRLDLVWLFLASFQLFPEDEWAKQGFRR